MRKLTTTYSALAAAVALVCAAAQAQDELTEAERAAIERQTEQIEERTEQLQAQTEELEEGTEEVVDEQELMERRQELVQMAEESLAELLEQNASADALYEEAHGYAVFDTTKGGLIVTGAGGTGVAMEKGSPDRTFMHLGQAGIGLGAGLQNYQLVLLFADEETYEQFVAGEWDGAISAQAAAGEAGVSAEEQFIEGIKAYRLTDAGLMAQVDVTGMRFWPSDRLNELQVAEADDLGDPFEAEPLDENLDEAADETEDAIEEADEALE